MLAQQVADERARFRRVKEELSICRRDVRKLISAAMEEGADGDWAAIEDIYIGLCARVPRSPTIEQIFDIVRELHAAGTTILLVEQNAQMALSIATRGYVLETGKITMTGTGQELLHDDNVRKAYLGG